MMGRTNAQMEIMGLAIIVILISLGLLFLIQFSLSKEPSHLKKTFTQTQLAANLLSSMLRTTSQDCFGNSISELLKDCTENFNAPTTQLRCENNLKSCDYLQDTFKPLLDQTLGDWGNQSYQFEAKIPGQSILKFSSGKCSGEKESKQNYLQTNAGTLTITMDICG